MRRFLTFLALSTAASHALAQAPAINIPAAAANAHTQAQQLEEVGYDPKVKRDPYGNILSDKPENTLPKTESQKLRNDVGGNLRSDRKMLGARSTNPSMPKPQGELKEIPVKTSTGAPLITPEGKPLVVKQPSNAPTQSITVAPDAVTPSQQ